METVLMLVIGVGGILGLLMLGIGFFKAPNPWDRDE